MQKQIVPLMLVVFFASTQFVGCTNKKEEVTPVVAAKPEIQEAVKSPVDSFQTYAEFMTPSIRRLEEIVKETKGDEKAIIDAIANDPVLSKMAAQHRWAKKKANFTPADAASVSTMLTAAKSPEDASEEARGLATKHKPALDKMSASLSSDDTTADGRIDCMKYPDSPACNGDTGSGGCDTTPRYTECMTDCAGVLGGCISVLIPTTAGIGTPLCLVAYAICADECGGPCQ